MKSPFEIVYIHPRCQLILRRYIFGKGIHFVIFWCYWGWVERSDSRSAVYFLGGTFSTLDSRSADGSGRPLRHMAEF